MKIIIHFKIDKKAKENAQALVAKMSPELERRLGKVEEDIKKGRNLSPAFSSPEEMDKYLDSVSQVI